MAGVAEISAGGTAAGSVPTAYTPAVPGDWDIPRPTTYAEGLDQLAARVRILESVATPPQVYSCPSGVAVRDLVYKDTVSGEADKADASDPTKMRAIGFVASKSSPTSLILQSSGEMAGFGSLPLVPGTTYFADPTSPGGISATGGDPLSGEVSQSVGIAKTADILTISIALDPIAGP